MKRSIATLIVALGLAGHAFGAAYDESADAKAEVQAALSAAKAGHQRVLLIFGANWCPDCRALDASLGSEKNAKLMAKAFRIVKIDVGNFDKNQDLVALYGAPTKGGIPAAVIVSPDDKVLYSTKAGELADARQMDADGVYGFFSKVLAGLAPAP